MMVRSDFMEAWRLRMIQWKNRIRHHEEGAAAIEYAILASAIAAIIVVIVGLLGTAVLNFFSRLVFP